jgi:two-component system, NarL family, nitrate/nitrite response regulator NarL
MALTCLIVDDNPRFLEKAAAVLNRDGIVIAGLASNTRDALERVRELRPDIALVDISLGSESGLELARLLVDENGDALTVILVSTHAESDFAELIEEAPVAGFLPKAELSATSIRRIVDAA